MVELTVQHHLLRATHELDSLIEERFFALQARLQTDEASVRLECRRESSPALSVHLVTPGPDVFADDWFFATRQPLRGTKWFPPLASVGPVLAHGVAAGSDEDSGTLR